MRRIIEWYRDRVRRHDTGLFWVAGFVCLILLIGAGLTFRNLTHDPRAPPSRAAKVLSGR